MVGLIQKVLLDLVEAQAGLDGVADVRRRAGVAPERLFRLGEVYPDDEFQRLLQAAIDVLDLEETKFLDAYADQFFRDVSLRFSKWFSMAGNSREFLEFQTTIHNTFASGVVDPAARQAVKDKFAVNSIDGRNIVTHYRSPNRLCKLYRAFGRWVADYYGDAIEFDEPRCMLHGDEECEIHVKWTRIGREEALFDENGLALDDQMVANHHAERAPDL
jgi:hypothetical protein